MSTFIPNLELIERPVPKYWWKSKRVFFRFPSKLVMNLCLKKCLTEKKIRLEMKRSPRNMMTWKKVAVYDVIVHFLILAGIEPLDPDFWRIATEFVISCLLAVILILKRELRNLKYSLTLFLKSVTHFTKIGHF